MEPTDLDTVPDADVELLPPGSPGRDHRVHVAKCGAERAGKDPCGNPAGYRTAHPGIGNCVYHFGNTETHNRRAQISQARAMVETFGLPRDIDPQTALLEEVQRTAGIVSYLGHLVSELAEDELKQRSTDRQGNEWERASVWVEMYEEERKHLVRVSAEAIKCGVAERQVRIAEQAGDVIVAVLRGVLLDLGIAGDARVPQLVATHLRAIEGAQL